MRGEAARGWDRQVSGKGDKRRPTDESAYGDGWDRIFGNCRLNKLGKENGEPESDAAEDARQAEGVG